MTTAVDDMLGIGLYTPSEAAVYARLSTAVLDRWVHGSGAGGPVIHAQRADDPDRIITFLDFVQALAIRAIRREKKVPLQKIRQAIDTARDRYGVDYPFAMPHRTFLFRDDIIIEMASRDDLVQISGKNRSQLVIREVAELYMEALDFGDSNIAVRYRAFKHEDREIVMDPHRRLGKPLLPTCGYTAQALVNAYHTEGNIPDAAAALGVDVKDVSLAIRYFDFLGGTLAA